MGYTHYWRRDKNLDVDKFKKASADCKKVADWLRIPIQYEYNRDEPPVFDWNLIRFNGVGDDGHETFYVQRICTESFQFCKTARKEYDTVVVACLIVLKHYFGDDIVISSDGDVKDWQLGLNACQKCLGYGKISF